MSKLKIQDSDKRDIVTFDLETGHATISNAAQVGDAARAFWDAVQTAFLAVRQNQTSWRGEPFFLDFIFKGAKDHIPPGSLSFQPGNGGAGGKGGDIIIHLPKP